MEELQRRYKTRKVLLLYDVACMLKRHLNVTVTIRKLEITQYNLDFGVSLCLLFRNN